MDLWVTMKKLFLAYNIFTGVIRVPHLAMIKISRMDKIEDEEYGKEDVILI